MSGSCRAEPAEPRKFQRRFVQTLSFCALFFAGLALSAGAGNGVCSLLEDDAASPAATGATGASGPSGATGVAGKTSASQSVVHVVQAEPQAAPARPTVVPARVTAKAAATVVSRPLASSTASAKNVAVVKTHVARPALAKQTKPSSKPRSKPKHKRPRRHRRSIPRCRRSRRRRCG